VISTAIQRLRKHKLILIAVISVIALGLIFVVVRARERKRTTPPTAPLDVDVVQVQEQTVPIYSEWIGTTDGMVNADIRSQVSGYLLRRNYTEGAFVRTGQLLFGVTLRKSNGSPVLLVSLFSPNNSYDSLFLANYNNINVVDTLFRVPGVGDTKGTRRKVRVQAALPEKSHLYVVTPQVMCILIHSCQSSLLPSFTSNQR